MDTIEILMKKLPIEIINIILSFRPSHPVAKIMTPFINSYNPFVDRWTYYWEDLDYDFRHFIQVSRMALFMKTVECDEVQYHFTKKWAKIIKKDPSATHHSHPSTLKDYVLFLCSKKSSRGFELVDGSIKL